MKKRLFVLLVLCFAAAGCATAPKPKTVGQTIGSAIDSSVTWASNGIRHLLNK